MRLICTLAFVLTAIHLVPDKMRADSYTKLTPSDPIVHLANGKGSEVLYFSKVAGANLPVKIVLTDAVGKVNSIPLADFRMEKPVVIAENVFAMKLSVETTQFVDPGTPYEATLLLFDSEKTSSPASIKVKVQDDATIALDTVPATAVINTAIGGTLTPSYRLFVRNTGRSSINSIDITTSVLTDAPNHRNLQMTPLEIVENLTPGQFTGLDFNLPVPLFAGTYTGTLQVVANHSIDKQIPLTIQSRGPLAAYGVPFALFVLVIVVGFCVSSYLDTWFASGGLARAEAYLSLKSSEKTLGQHLHNLDVRRTNTHVDTPKAFVWVSEALRELQAGWQGYSERPPAEVTVEAERFATIAAAANLLWIALQTAEAQWSGNSEKLDAVSKAIDAIPYAQTSADLARYRQDLNNALLVQARAIDAQAGSVQTSSAEPTRLDKLRRKIRRMAALYQFIVWIVVFVTAYSSFYAGHPAFGTLADYFAVFLWALGLTSTGTQIVARVHKPV